MLLSECVVPLRSIGAGQTLIDIQWVPLYADWEAGVQRILDVIQPILPRIPPNIQRLSHAIALADIGDPTGVPVLVKALSDENSFVRRIAASALAQIDDSRAVPALMDALNDKDDLVRASAADALTNIGTPKALKAVEEYQKSKQSGAQNNR